MAGWAVPERFKRGGVEPTPIAAPTFSPPVKLPETTPAVPEHEPQLVPVGPRRRQ